MYGDFMGVVCLILFSVVLSTFISGASCVMGVRQPDSEKVSVSGGYILIAIQESFKSRKKILESSKAVPQPRDIYPNIFCKQQFNFPFILFY